MEIPWNILLTYRHISGNQRKPKEKARVENLETMATMGTGRRQKQSEIMILLINGYDLSSLNKKSRLPDSSCRLQFKHVYIPSACHISFRTFTILDNNSKTKIFKINSYNSAKDCKFREIFSWFITFVIRLGTKKYFYDLNKILGKKFNVCLHFI